MITSLKPNEIFVFGSNLAGIHGAGAAKQAMESFGAVYGVGEGLTGQCYAFPTLDRYLKPRFRISLGISRDKFFDCARDNPDKQFLLTKVGCGLAGYEESIMRDMFRNAPNNVIKPDGW